MTKIKSENYIIVYSETFKKAVVKMTAKEQEKIFDKIKMLSDHPFYPSLRSKKLKGNKKYFECSVNMDIRIIWQYENGRIILIVDVGHHDVLDKY